MLIFCVVSRREHTLVWYTETHMNHSNEGSGPLNSLSHENRGGDKPPIIRLEMNNAG